MGSGYDRIRKAAIGAGAASAVLAGGVADEAAAVLISNFVTLDQGSFVYYVSNTVGHPTIAGTAFGLTDASTPTDSDTWDGAFTLGINGSLFRDSDGNLDVQQAGGVAELTAQGKTAGINVRAVFRSFGNNGNFRVLYTLTNRSDKRKNLVLSHGSDFGQDGAADVDGSEDGNFDADPGDSWVTIGDESDPVSTIGFGDVTKTFTSQPPGTDELVANLTAKLKPRQSKNLLFVGHLDDLIADGNSFGGSCFDTGTEVANCGFLNGLSSGDRAKVFNWVLP